MCHLIRADLFFISRFPCPSLQDEYWRLSVNSGKIIIKRYRTWEHLILIKSIGIRIAIIVHWLYWYLDDDYSLGFWSWASLSREFTIKLNSQLHYRWINRLAKLRIFVSRLTTSTLAWLCGRSGFLSANAVRRHIRISGSPLQPFSYQSGVAVTTQLIVTQQKLTRNVHHSGEYPHEALRGSEARNIWAPEEGKIWFLFVFVTISR